MNWDLTNNEGGIVCKGDGRRGDNKASGMLSAIAMEWTMQFVLLPQRRQFCFVHDIEPVMGVQAPSTA